MSELREEEDLFSSFPETNGGYKQLKANNTSDRSHAIEVLTHPETKIAELARSPVTANPTKPNIHHITDRKQLSSNELAGKTDTALTTSDIAVTPILRYEDVFKSSQGQGNDSDIIRFLRTNPAEAGIAILLFLLSLAGFSAYADDIRQRRMERFKGPHMIVAFAKTITKDNIGIINAHIKTCLQKSRALNVKYEEVEWISTRGSLYLVYKDKPDLPPPPQKSFLQSAWEKLTGLAATTFTLMNLYCFIYWFIWIFKAAVSPWEGGTELGFGYGTEIPGSMAGTLALGIAAPIIIGWLPYFAWRLRNWLLNNHSAQYQSNPITQWCEKWLFAFKWWRYTAAPQSASLTENHTTEPQNELTSWQRLANVALVIPNLLQVLLSVCPRFILGFFVIAPTTLYIRIKYGAAQSQGRPLLASSSAVVHDLSTLLQQTRWDLQHSVAYQPTTVNNQQGNQILLLDDDTEEEKSVAHQNLALLNPSNPQAIAATQQRLREEKRQLQRDFNNAMQYPSTAKLMTGYSFLAITSSLGMWGFLQFFFFPVNDHIHIISGGNAGVITTDILGMLIIITSAIYGINQLIKNYQALEKANQFKETLQTIHNTYPPINDNNLVTTPTESKSHNPSQAALGEPTLHTPPPPHFSSTNYFNNLSNKHWVETFVDGIMVLYSIIAAMTIYRFAVLPGMEAYIPFGESANLTGTDFIAGFVVISVAWFAMKAFLNVYNGHLATANEYGQRLGEYEDYCNDYRNYFNPGHSPAYLLACQHPHYPKPHSPSLSSHGTELDKEESRLGAAAEAAAPPSTLEHSSPSSEQKKAGKKSSSRESSRLSDSMHSSFHHDPLSLSKVSCSTTPSPTTAETGAELPPPSSPGLGMRPTSSAEKTTT